MPARKVTFEWDEEKDNENQEKHGVSFALVQQAFLDPCRVIAEDIKHSSEEDRFYCIGGPFMKTKIRYTEEPMGELKVVKDFLPSPGQLVLKEENVKITISLKKSSIAFFKEQAKKHKTSYQKMIREVVDWYASHCEKGA